MSIDNINLKPLNGVQNTSATASTANAEYIEEEENLFVDGVKDATKVDKTDLEYLEKEVGVLESIGEKIGLDLTGDLETDFDALNEYPAKLDEMLQKIEKLIEEKLQALKDLEAQQARLLSDEENVQAQLNNLNNQALINQAEQNELGAKIAKTQKDNIAAQEEYTAMYNSELAKAESSYNPETDGDKEAFIQDKLSGLGKANITDVSSMESNLSSLKATGNTLTSTIGTLNTTLASIQDKLQKVDVQITTIQTEIDVANADKKEIEEERATIPAKAMEALKNGLNPEEWGLIEKAGIDLSETRSDGNPRYMLAKGNQDGKYHLYDTGTTNGQGKWASVARQTVRPSSASYYAIPKGNGYLSYYKEVPEGTPNSSKTFAFTISDTEFKSDKQNATYATSSPLGFDIGDDGYETADELMQFDIDGDGKLDNINNVLEGILAFDKDGDGVVGKDGSELFGNNTDLDNDGKADGYKDGFEALKALANKEGLIDGDKDMALDADDLKLLSEKYGLTMQMGYNGKTQSLESLGITQINLAKTNETHLEDNFDGKHNQLMTQEGATFVQNGEEKDYADIWNAKK